MNGLKYVELMKEKLKMHMHVHGSKMDLIFTIKSRHRVPKEILFSCWNVLKTVQIIIQSRTYGLLWRIRCHIFGMNLMQAIKDVWFTEISGIQQGGHAKYCKTDTFRCHQVSHWVVLCFW